MGNHLKCCLSMLILRSFVLLLNQPFTGERKSNAGRPPIDCVLMFRVLFLQRYYGLSDHQIEYQINLTVRVSASFLVLNVLTMFSDEKTVWKYRELLTNTGVYDKLFRNFIVSWKWSAIQ